MATRLYVLTTYENARAKIADVLRNHATDEQLESLEKLARIPGNAPDLPLLYGAALAEQVAVLAELVDRQAERIQQLEAALKGRK